MLCALIDFFSKSNVMYEVQLLIKMSRNDNIPYRGTCTMGLTRLLLPHQHCKVHQVVVKDLNIFSQRMTSGVDKSNFPNQKPQYFIA